jgi:alcohol dehydrogenase class IV
MENVKQKGLPFIIIPTTAGSGSEWGGAAVVTDPADDIKKVIYSRYTWASAIIIDPLMTLNLPRRITGDTGIDALSHAIESYTSWKANVISDMFAEKAIELISKNLRIAYANGRKHLEARYQMALGAVMGIQACINASNGFGHSLNYPVAMRSHLSHGAAVAVMLPHVMRFNLLGCSHKFARIADLMGEDTIGLTEMEAAQKAVTSFRKLSVDVEMPQRLRDVGITREDFPGFLDFLYKYQQYGMENNARDLTREDILQILEAAY